MSDESRLSAAFEPRPVPKAVTIAKAPAAKTATVQRPTRFRKGADGGPADLPAPDSFAVGGTKTAEIY